MASDPMTPISDSALAMGCVCTTRLMPQNTAMPAKMKKISAVIVYFEVSATTKPVTSRLTMASGNRKIQAKRISWS